MNDYVYEDIFKNRLAILRTQRGVSAREMSLSLGQNAGYINDIESGKTLPSMMLFFYICEYLEITPSSFLILRSKCPKQLRKLILL
nr:MAG TPA: helix-turn-helix domain protein [Caudoviricetes sp.]